ncbi:MAG: hypothetical protein IT158_19015 [Bryobacterales bacterium]|nr:hypothetical protein [Bryobacterales bacterium]
MNSGSELVETWIPDGGFEIQRRKVKTADGSSAVMEVMECLVPKWSGAELTADRPLHRQPCLHRVLAACRHDQIVAMANNCGLLTVTVPRFRKTSWVDSAKTLATKTFTPANATFAYANPYRGDVSPYQPMRSIVFFFGAWLTRREHGFRRC